MDPLVATMGGIVLLLVGCYLWLRPRSQAPAAQERYHFQCSRCGHRIRFLTSQAGKLGKCRRCKQTFVFPHPDTQGVSRVQKD
jgi:hypothetical protein